MASGVKIFVILILILMIATIAYVGYKVIPRPTGCDPLCMWYEECTAGLFGNACTPKSYDGFDVIDNQTTTAPTINTTATNVESGHFDKDCIQACKNNTNCTHVVVDTAHSKCYLKTGEVELINPINPGVDTRVTFKEL